MFVYLHIQLICHRIERRLMTAIKSFVFAQSIHGDNQSLSELQAMISVGWRNNPFMVSLRQEKNDDVSNMY
jgi:hypothetical protein